MRPKEIEILTQLAVEAKEMSQRDIAKEAGVSVGMVNAVLRKMIAVGYVKAKTFNRRQWQYCLTPRGLLEVSRRSYHYLVRSVGYYQSVERTIEDIVSTQYQNGHRVFAMYGTGVLRDLTERALKRRADITVVHPDGAPEYPCDVVVINVDGTPRAYPLANGIEINVVEQLLNMPLEHEGRTLE